MQEQQRNESEGFTIDLSRVVQALLKWMWVIVAATLLFGIVAAIYSYAFITPTYQSGFSAYVNNKQTSGNSNTTTSDLNASIALTYVYSAIIQSDTVLNEAIEKCGAEYTAAELAGKLTVSLSDTTAVIRVYLVDTDPQMAMKLATAISEVAPIHVARVVDNSSMSIIDAPKLPTKKYAPNHGQNIVIGALLGMLVSIIAVVVLEILNDSVQNSDELEKRHGLIALGVIPDFEEAGKQYGGYGYGSGRRTGGKQA